MVSIITGTSKEKADLDDRGLRNDRLATAGNKAKMKEADAIIKATK